MLALWNSWPSTSPPGEEMKDSRGSERAWSRAALSPSLVSPAGRRKVCVSGFEEILAWFGVRALKSASRGRNAFKRSIQMQAYTCSRGQARDLGWGHFAHTFHSEEILEDLKEFNMDIEL